MAMASSDARIICLVKMMCMFHHHRLENSI